MMEYGFQKPDDVCPDYFTHSQSEFDSSSKSGHLETSSEFLTIQSLQNSGFGLQVQRGESGEKLYAADIVLDILPKQVNIACSADSAVAK